jgi:hypothetical protein
VPTCTAGQGNPQPTDSSNHKRPVEEHCNHLDCSDMDCSHCISWLLPHQYDTVEDLQDQVSDIADIMDRGYSCLTDKTITDCLPELKEQVLTRMSDLSHSITILVSKLGIWHPLVIKHKRAHNSLVDMVTSFVELVRQGSLRKDIEDILDQITACLKAKEATVMHLTLLDLKEQVLSLMFELSHGITILTNRLGKEHTLVIKTRLKHDLLEDTVNNLIEAVGLHTNPTADFVTTQPMAVGIANQAQGPSNTVLHPSNEPFIVVLDTTNPMAVSTTDTAAAEETTEGDDTKSADAPTDRQTPYNIKPPEHRPRAASVRPPGETTTSKARTPSMAEATIPVPAPMPIHIGFLNKQQSEIMEVICTIHDNINQKRADLMVCIPELRRVMCGLMEEHLVDTRLLATELSIDHNLLANILHHDKLETQQMTP